MKHPQYIRQATLPSVSLVGLYVSVIRSFLDPYIAGLRFCFEGGREMQLGYILPELEVYLEMPADAGEPPKMEGILWCLRVGLDVYGIHAVALSKDPNPTSGDVKWAGSGEGLLVERLEVKCGGVTDIRIHADVSIQSSALCGNCYFPSSHFLGLQDCLDWCAFHS